MFTLTPRPNVLSRTMSGAGRLVFFCLMVSGCGNNGKLEWIRFNEEGQTLSIEVTGSDDLGEDQVLELMSSTGVNAVGVATMTPGSGPIGTRHELNIVVDDAYELAVQRVTVDVVGARGEDSFTLRQDSADPGTWQLVIESLGDIAGGEARTDSFTVSLWEPNDLVDVQTTAPETSQ